MGWILRKPADRVNPTLAGGVYGRYITAGMGVYWTFRNGRVYFILFISDGGKYGMNTPSTVEYKSVPLPSNEYQVHPGTFTKQVVILASPQAVDVDNDIINFTGNPFVNGDPIRFFGPFIPGGITDAKRWVFNRNASGFQVSSTPPPTNTLIDITYGVPGPLGPVMYKADAGWDDPVQGLPTFCPETENTFSGIYYIEGILPQPYIENQEPDWADFRIAGIGRKLMDYNNVGTELGVTTNTDLCCNPALADADCILNEFKNSSTRIDWTSWKALRDTSLLKIWQRADTTKSGMGFPGKYYTYTVTAPPALSDGTLRLTRRDKVMNTRWLSGVGPGGGIPADKFIIVWEGQLKARYSELYTFTASHDDGVKVYVNGVLIINQWTTTGDHSGTAILVEDTLVAIKIEFFKDVGEGYMRLNWSSPSQIIEVVPTSRVYDSDEQVNRYEFNGAYPKATEASVVHEEIMLRAPGWDWTDKDGKIVYLAPDRSTQYDFVFDFMDDSVDAAILERTFEKTRRHRRTRRNFVLYSYRNQLLTGYPEEFVEENRPRLRQLGGGVPTNDPPEELMVMCRSLADRYANDDMIFNNDPPYDLSLAERRPSSKLTKNMLVRVKNFVQDDRRVEDSTCIVTQVDRKGNRFDFVLLPIVTPFYTDEPVGILGGP